jgi:hypothetical protein
MTSSGAPPRSSGLSSCVPQGAERVSLWPHWTRTGGACIQHAADPAGRRLGTPRRAEDPYPRALACDGTPALAATPAACARTRCAWAAPPPRLTRTGAPDTLSRPFESDGMRAQQSFSVAGDHTNGALHSPCEWRLHLKTCVVPPRVVGTCARQSRQDTAPTARDAGVTRRNKRNSPLSGGVCLLTRRGLIRVRRRLSRR